jgi:hypothetical protein
MRSYVPEGKQILLVNTPRSHLHNTSAAGMRSGLADAVNLNLRWRLEAPVAGCGQASVFIF